MIKITFMGAGSSVFAKNVLGDSMLADDLPPEDLQRSEPAAASISYKRY